MWILIIKLEDQLACFYMSDPDGFTFIEVEGGDGKYV